ncbi:TetR/AcrR family transcriptional regulator [Paenibacillus caui]|uniref:TetR/AcrR family transcriptional regulator n=1 Tax=Paenibacillus caui TaxID=2873927 RepID=UPI001CAA28C6|nr:TetR/AcrR family transcriptional regulator [Paenibacillus caui]
MTEKDKREKIIEAAYQVLAERGYDEASTKEIARTAGVAQGLIGYYFSSKDLLFAEVFRRESEKYCESLAYIKSYGEQQLTLDGIKSILKVPKSKTADHPALVKLRYELFALGLRNQAVSGSIKETLASKRAHLTSLIEAVSNLPEEHSRRLAPILLAAFDGLALQRMCDDEFPYDEAYDTLAVMIDSYLKAIKS